MGIGVLDPPLVGTGGDDGDKPIRLDIDFLTITPLAQVYEAVMHKAWLPTPAERTTHRRSLDILLTRLIEQIKLRPTDQASTIDNGYFQTDAREMYLAWKTQWQDAQTSRDLITCYVQTSLGFVSLYGFIQERAFYISSLELQSRPIGTYPTLTEEDVLRAAIQSIYGYVR